jgi:hypothetical protein
LLVSLILAALWLAGAPPEVPDLRFSAPVVARPGTSIGLRAWQIARDEDGVPAVVAPTVAVELRNGAGLTIATTTLSQSRGQGVEGSLEVPRDLHGEHSLVATAEIDGSEVSVARALHVREAIDSRRKKGRSVNAFQVYELGPLRIVDRALAPSVLDARVEEGACVPDLRCTLIVWVGKWQGRIRVRSLAGVRSESPVVEAVGGFARLDVLVRGQEGRVAIEALGDGATPVAAREVRLPLVSGGLVARASQEGRGIRLDWDAIGGTQPVLVDVFADHRWTRATSLSQAEPTLEPLPPGVWRLQVRPDLFSSNTAAVAFVVVPGSDDHDRLRPAAEAVMADAEQQGLDPLAMAILDGSFAGAADGALRALFAVPAFDVVETGPGVSSRIGIDEARSRAQDTRRWWAAGVILIVGFIVSMVLLRVELVAQARARRLLVDLGEGAPPARAAFGRGLWAFVLLVFVLMAVLALSKRWF